MAITRSVYNAPGQNVNRDVHTWDYAFEADNGIKQAASGEMKQIGEDEVVVMRGSYQYIGADGELFIKKQQSVSSISYNISIENCLTKSFAKRS